MARTWVGSLGFRAPYVVLGGLLTLALSFAGASPTRAQEPTQDPAAVLHEAALALEADGELELADALFEYILRRYPDSDAAAAIREAWSLPGSRRVDSSGRTELVVWSTLYGLWLGVAVPGMLGADAPEPFGVGLLLGGPLGFIVSRGSTRSAPMGDGAAEAITWGGSWGTWQGFGWANVLDLGSSCDEFGSCGGASAEAVFGSMVALGVAGLVTGTALARSREIAPGRSTMASLGSLWGTWVGFAVAGIAEVDDGDTALAIGLTAGNIGLAAGALMHPGAPVPRSRARMASIVGVAGGLAGLGLDLLIQPDNPQVGIGIPLAGSLIGLAIGSATTREQNPEPAAPGGRAQERPGVSWSLGGPVMPAAIEARGRRLPGVSITLLSARF